MATGTESPSAAASPGRAAGGPASFAHVATLAFLAGRIAPPLAFPVTLAGGVALARAGERLGTRQGYGAGIGAVLETIAIVGPAKMGGPISQLITAPMLGRLEGRGVPATVQVIAATGLRFLYTVVTAAFFIWIVAGGLDAYTGTYDTVVGWIPQIPEGPAAALVVTALALLGWAAFAATVQVYVFRHALRRWPEPGEESHHAAPAPHPGGRVFDPRAVALAAVIGFAILLVDTEWGLLAGSAGWLALVWVAARPDREVLPSGAVLAAALAVSGFLVTWIGGEGLESALQHAARAALLVATATWLRGAVGARGFREVAQRSLRRMRRIPAAREAAEVVGELGPERRLGAAARSLVRTVGGKGKKPLAMIDSILTWVAAESARFRATAPAAGLRLSLLPRDAVLVASALVPLAVMS